MFHRDLGLRVDSYALVIANQEKIFETLLRHLERDYLNQNTWNAVPALLEFVVSFSTDLVTDFHQYFYRTFDVLKNLLVTKDLGLLENIFTCLSRLIKLCHKFLREDMQKAIDIFVSLVVKEKVIFKNIYKKSQRCTVLFNLFWSRNQGNTFNIDSLLFVKNVKHRKIHSEIFA